MEEIGRRIEEEVKDPSKDGKIDLRRPCQKRKEKERKKKLKDRK